LNGKRLREKITSYIGSTEYKERDSSLEAAKVKIEDYMKTYKGWEKETKMKAFSNEGLASVKADKKVEEPHKVEWLTEGLKALGTMLSASETELENFGNRPKKAKRGKYEHKIDAQKSKIEYIKKQMKNIELLIASVEHDTLSQETLDNLKESFVNYLKEPNNPQTKSSWENVTL
jgi:CCR4-NOT transcriptional regulation complex NOT5 subunit